MLSVPRRFENLDRVLNCLAFYSVVAWRLMYVCYLGRECPEIDCEVTGDLELLAGEVNWRKQIIAQRTDLHGTSWLFDGRKLHCFCRRHWMVIDPQTLETETFATDFEALGIVKLSPRIPFHNPFFSAHYGILVPTQVNRDRQRTLELFQIRFP